MFLTPEYALIAAFLVALVVLYVATTTATTDWFSNADDADADAADAAADADDDKAKCRANAKKSLWKLYDWRQRKLNNGKWKCDRGWEDTGCTWNMGKEFETKHCRRKRSDASQYEEAAKTGTMTAGLTNSDNARKGRTRCRKYRDGKTVNPPMTEGDIAWCYSNLSGFKTPAPAATQAAQSGTIIIDNTTSVTDGFPDGQTCQSNSQCASRNCKKSTTSRGTGPGKCAAKPTPAPAASGQGSSSPPGRPSGADCNLNSECASGSCSLVQMGYGGMQGSCA